jgi:hypothetical protein
VKVERRRPRKSEEDADWHAYVLFSS